MAVHSLDLTNQGILTVTNVRILQRDAAAVRQGDCGAVQGP